MHNENYTDTRSLNNEAANIHTSMIKAKARTGGLMTQPLSCASFRLKPLAKRTMWNSRGTACT